MRVKAIQDLAQLTDEAIFAQVEIGATLCVSNAKRIYQDSLVFVEPEHARGSEILRLAAEEEASKVLILLDAVRCPRSTLTVEFGRQLQYFNEHLAKGIYAQYCGMRPAALGEVRRWIENERKEFYLDGPNGVDWIFYNDILRRREETIYVDYVENEGQHVWHDPAKFDDLGVIFRMSTNPVLRLVDALFRAGCFEAGALNVIAQIWRPLSIDDDFSWQDLREANVKTLESMHGRGLLKTTADETCRLIVNEWLFPLYKLDLRKERVNKEDLRNIQKRWSPYGEV